ncbi:MAG: FAD-dependent oxidoreductase [Micromonosporaceae bacterium]
MGQPVDDVLVIGAGVSGLTTAVCLAEAGLRVLIYAELPPHRTTSAAAGALWAPHLVEASGRVADWSRRTLDEFVRLAGDPAAGVRIAGGVEVSRGPAVPPEWGAALAEFRPCQAAEVPAGYTTGWRFAAPLVEMPVYLSYLSARFTAAGGRLEAGVVRSLEEVSGAAGVVVNCTGVGARDLARDSLVSPVRGQVVVVANPGITEFFVAADENAGELVYFVPHRDTVVLGGTQEPGNWDLRPDPATARLIVERCGAIDPRLRSAEVVAHRAGLRPVRPHVRVEAQRLKDGALVYHNYGHGGAGITLSWGCAREVASLVTGGGSPASSGG